MLVLGDASVKSPGAARGRPGPGTELQGVSEYEVEVQCQQVDLEILDHGRCVGAGGGIE
jgi:hypothetical protein